MLNHHPARDPATASLKPGPSSRIRMPTISLGAYVRSFLESKLVESILCEQCVFSDCFAFAMMLMYDLDL